MGTPAAVCPGCLKTIPVGLSGDKGVALYNHMITEHGPEGDQSMTTSDIQIHSNHY